MPQGFIQGPKRGAIQALCNFRQAPHEVLGVPDATCRRHLSNQHELLQGRTQAQAWLPKQCHVTLTLHLCRGVLSRQLVDPHVRKPCLTGSETFP